MQGRGCCPTERGRHFVFTSSPVVPSQHPALLKSFAGTQCSQELELTLDDPLPSRDHVGGLHLQNPLGAVAPFQPYQVSSALS